MWQGIWHVVPSGARYGVLAGVGNLVIAISGALAQDTSSVSAVPATDGATIIALGDSLTAGYGLPSGDGFVPQLQDWLTQSGVNATILNAGVSGDTTAGGLARIDWALDPEADAIIVALGGNDYLRAIDPASSRDNLAAILERAQGAGLEVLLVGITAGPNYGPQYARDFNAMYVDLAAEYGADLRPDFFAGLVDEQESGTLRDYMQDDGIHPNAEGVAEIVSDLGPAVAELAARAAE